MNMGMSTGGERKIKVKIDPLGNPTVEAVGFNGVGCADATKAIEQALSGNGAPNTRVLKPEWHQMESEGQHNTVTW
jgi:hypothetical protein